MLETETSKRISIQTKDYIERIDKMNSTTQNFFEYLNRTQQLNEKVSKNIKTELISFEEFYPKARDPHLPKFEPMMSFIENLKVLCSFIEKVSKENLSEISLINTCSAKQLEKVTKKSQTFFNNMEEYSEGIQTYNKNYQTYEANCSKLTQAMRKSFFTQNPIYYYNLQTNTETSKSIERKFQECQNSEKDLIGKLELLQQKRKNVCENLKSIREQYIVSFSCSMTRVLQGSKILVDFKKDSFYPKQHRSSESKERFIDQTSREDLDELNSILNDRNRDLKSKCEEYKTRLIQRTEKLLLTQKKFSQELTNQIVSFSKSSDELSEISKSSFKTGNLHQVCSQVKSFCGNSMYSIMNLSIMIADNPIKVLSNIGKIIEEKEKKVHRIVSQNQQSLKQFKKNSTSTLTQGKYDNQNGFNSQRNQRSSLRNQINFRDVVYDFIRFQKGLDLELNEVLIQLNDFVIRESQQVLLKNLLRKQKQQEIVNIIDQFQPESAIVSTIQADRGYDFLFRDETFQKIHLSNFKSALQQRPQEAKKILQKKASRQSSAVSVSRAGCCGIQSKKSKREKVICEATLMGKNTLKVPGQIEISQKGISFLEKKTNPFLEKMQLWVPTNEIKSFHKSDTKQGLQVVEIITSMGTLYFQSQNNNLLEEGLEKNMISKTERRKQLEIPGEKFDKSKSNELSMSGRQSSSYNYKVNFDSGIIDPNMTGKSTKKIKESILLKQFSEKLKMTKFFSDELNGSKVADLQNQYTYDSLYKFKVNQRRNCQNGTTNQILLKFDWKISFPDAVLKSYHHSELVKIQLNEERVKLTFLEHKRQDQHLMTRRTFFQQIQKMNRNLSNFSAKYCQRICEVVVENDIQNSQHSQFSEFTISEFGVQGKSFSRV